MDETVVWCARVLFVLVCVPVLVYFVMKFGTLGYLNAKDQFQKFQKLRRRKDESQRNADD